VSSSIHACLEEKREPIFVILFVTVHETRADCLPLEPLLLILFLVIVAAKLLLETGNSTIQVGGKAKYGLGMPRCSSATFFEVKVGHHHL